MRFYQILKLLIIFTINKTMKKEKIGIIKDDRVKELTAGKEVVKVIVVPKKLVNIVVKG